MASDRTKTSDDGNTGFGFRTSVADHKPGFVAAEAHKGGDHGDHRARPRDQKDVPRGTLAERLSKSKKGG